MAQRIGEKIRAARPPDADRERHSGLPYTAPETPPSAEEAPRSARPNLSRLGRIARNGLLVEAVFLVALGAAGVVRSAPAGLTAQTPTHVLWFRLNLAHSLLLLGTGLAVFAVCRSHRALQRFAWTQTVVYMVLYVFGTAFSAGTGGHTLWNLNPADNFLHASLFLIGVVAVMTLYSHWLDPELDQPAYVSSRRTGAEDQESRHDSRAAPR